MSTTYRQCCSDLRANQCRTIFLLQYISDAKLPEIIHQTTNKVEQFNAFSKWLSFVNDGKIKALTPEESEKHIKYVDLLANIVILDNTLISVGNRGQYCILR